uniref:ATP-dependent Clp protease proteolytic subunit n=1 Tax=Tecomaria capensis TaxID=140035 RepID=A0A2P1GAC9_TECCA|nr:clp protease proteolytic subunit [Tecomaria capensis]AVM81914.1 clp protease proteolytic subunit [Tecomaria capensis]
MPVGVPKIVFGMPEDEDPNCNRLYHLRYLFLGQELNSEIGNQIAGLLIYFTLEDPTQEFTFFINSPGGSVLYGLTIYDLMENLPPDVTTIGMGMVSSMASFLLTGGTMNKRTALPNARVMLHQPVASFYESLAGDFWMEEESVRDLRDRVIEIYTQRLGQPSEIVEWHMEKEIFMTATEAKAFGIVDQIGEKGTGLIKKN